MRYSTTILIAVFLLVGISASVGCVRGSRPVMQFAVTGIGGDPGMQNPTGPQPSGPGGGSPAAPGTPPAGGVSDASKAPAGAATQAPTDPKVADALKGIRDYEVTYDTSKSHAENTPPELRALGVEYASPDDPVGKHTEAIKKLNLVSSLANRYDSATDKYGAKIDKDFAPEDTKHTFNYFQPRTDPFSIPDQIPDELRPAVTGSGLEGTVDPELLKQLQSARYETNLRFIPIIVIGVLMDGPYRGCIYTIAGTGYTSFIQEGSSQCLGMFSISASQVSEDYVVLTLVGTYGRGCQYAATNPVVRTFHVNR
jgi:hypothetical protein